MLLAGAFTALALCVGLIAVLYRHWSTPAGPHDVRIEVSGAAGLKVVGTFEVDGETRKERGVVPVTFTFRARKLSYTITKGEQPGELSQTAYLDGTFFGSVGGSHKNLHGTVVDGRFTGIGNDSN
jgi:hypothetical protein